MPYRVTLEMDSFNGEVDAAESHEDLALLLDFLIARNSNYLRRRVGRDYGQNPAVPLLYASGVRYEPEPLGAEFWRDIPTCLRVAKEGGGSDCLPASTLVLRDDYTFTPIIALKPGDRIMEDGQPTIVQECVITGDKPVLAFDLDNGCTLRCSPNHRLFKAAPWRKSALPAETEEVRAETVRVGDRLRAPTKPLPPIVGDMRTAADITGLFHQTGFARARVFFETAALSLREALEIRVLCRRIDRAVSFKHESKRIRIGNPKERHALHVLAVREEAPELSVDITTSTGRYYLPESDTIVHNCEDLVCWQIAELRERFGIPARPLIIPQLQPNGRYLYHIQTWTPDQGIDDPSARLGMQVAPAAAPMGGRFNAMLRAAWPLAA